MRADARSGGWYHRAVVYLLFLILLLPLAGAFQASNALVAAGLCIAAGDRPDAVIAALEAEGYEPVVVH